MIRLLASLILVLTIPAAQGAEPASTRLSAQDLERMLVVMQKPGKPASAQAGNDSCRYANDMECDEPGFGTGACAAGTDHSDCWRIMTGREDNSCEWPRDGECDEPRIGTGACTQGTDLADCGDLSHLRFRDDSCALAFNGQCDEPGVASSGRCEARTDRSDCVGRDRPLTINDHFFGRDDRVLLDRAVLPWRAIGVLEADGACTATLVGPDVLVTAAHCIEDAEGRVIGRGARFETGAGVPGGPWQARVVDILTDPRRAEMIGSDGDDGADWALLRLDSPIGREAGWLGVRALLAEAGEHAARRARLYQAGYSWDTGENLSGNTGCTIVEVYPDNTLAHDCDTTRGDSGSPFLVEEDGNWFVVATDSSFRPNPKGPFEYIAARSEGWIGEIAAFAARPLPTSKFGATGKPQ